MAVDATFAEEFMNTNRERTPGLSTNEWIMRLEREHDREHQDHEQRIRQIEGIIARYMALWGVITVIGTGIMQVAIQLFLKGH